MRLGLREVIFLLVLLAMPAMAYLTIFRPNTEEIAEVEAEIQQRQAKLEQLEQATRSISDLGQEIDKLSHAIVAFEQKLPAQQEVEVMLHEVWELAHRNGLTPQSVRPDRSVSTPQYTRLPIRMTILGDFDGFYKFMLELEQLQRITRLPNLKLDKMRRGEEGMMQADLILDIFFEGRPAEAGGRPAGA